MLHNKYSIDELKSSKNIADLLEDEDLQAISAQVRRGYERDEDSRGEWEELIDKAMAIAKQTIETKNHPWPNSSNVKYPLITQSAIDFAARTFPEIVQTDRIVQAAVIGDDPNGDKRLRGDRVSQFMSYQFKHQCRNWEEDLDKLLHMLPILGTVFKKTYYDSIHGYPVSEVCNPKKIVVNHNVKSLEEARRITHKITFYLNDIVERIRRGLFRDVDITKLASSEYGDDDGPIDLLEQHCYIDLDGDGYSEPYIVIVHEKSGEVLRIVQRFSKVHKNQEGEVTRIEPTHYFTDFHFIKSPDGGFYSLGSGALLYPLNKAINTLLNQLIDAGTLSNMQGGFIGRGLRLKSGEFRAKMGEWKVLDAATGTNLSQNIFPFPTKEPSGTLFQLLGMLLEVGKDLSSVNDVLQGKQPAQNVPATTILTLVEQGMKVFNAINKRVFRSLRKEFRKVYDLNRQYLSNKDYSIILDQPNLSVKADFEDDSIDILPVADPTMASDAQRLVKAQALLNMPTLDPYVTTKYYLEALQLGDKQIAELLPKPDPNAPPSPDQQKIMAEVQKLQAQARALLSEAAVNSQKSVLDAAKLDVYRRESVARNDESAARIMKMKQDAQNSTEKVSIAAAKADAEIVRKDFDSLHQREKDELDLSLRTIESAQKEKEIQDNEQGDEE